MKKTRYAIENANKIVVDIQRTFSGLDEENHV